MKATWTVEVLQRLQMCEKEVSQRGKTIERLRRQIQTRDEKIAMYSDWIETKTALIQLLESDLRQLRWMYWVVVVLTTCAVCSIFI